LRAKSLIKTGRPALSQNACAAQRIGDGEFKQLAPIQTTSRAFREWHPDWFFNPANATPVKTIQEHELFFNEV